MSSAADIQRLLDIFDQLFILNSDLKPTYMKPLGQQPYPEAWEILASIEKSIPPQGISDFQSYDDIIANLQHPSMAQLLWRVSPEICANSAPVHPLNMF